MSQADIRARRKKLDDELRKAKASVEAVIGKMRALEAECDHPKMRKYSAMGEIGNYCPDCGYQD